MGKTACGDSSNWLATCLGSYVSLCIAVKSCVHDGRFISAEKCHVFAFSIIQSSPVKIKSDSFWFPSHTTFIYLFIYLFYYDDMFRSTDHHQAISTKLRKMCIVVQIVFLYYFNTCTVHILLFCTITNIRTIISQIITFLHLSTLSCHPQELVINTLPSYTSISNAAVGNTVYS